MARGRRGGPPDLKSTLGSLLRTTLEQVGAVKDAVEEQARGRGGLIDQALEQRRRKDAMAKLGEIVHRLAQSGELGELALDPKIGMCLEEIDQLDGHSGDQDWLETDTMSRARGPEAVSSANYVPRAAEASAGEYRVWRPVHPSKATRDRQAGEPLDAVPGSDIDAQANEAVPQHVAPTDTRTRSARLPRKSAQRSGSAIQFVQESARPEDPDSDEDLESYMHDDDVPSKD